MMMTTLSVFLGFLAFAAFVLLCAWIEFVVSPCQILWHRDWYFGFHRFHKREALSTIYVWWVQIGPLEVRKWK